jgi:hypothetical protein
VLYLSLEEQQRQTNRRLHMLMPNPNDFLADLTFVYKLDQPLMAGGAALLDQCLSQHQFELVIIDSLLAIVRQSGRSGDVMQIDYNIINTLKQLAEKHGLAIIVVAHTRKMGSDNAIDTVQGTMGLVAASDNVWVLSRDVHNNALLTVSGRDIYNGTFGLKQERDSGWKVTGEGDEVTQSVERREILDLLRENGPMRVVNIAKTLHKNVSTTQVLIGKLYDLNLVTRTKYGVYKIVDENPVA